MPFSITEAVAVKAGRTALVKSPARLVARGTIALVTLPSSEVAACSSAGTAREIACSIALV